uniref:Uncharacterized protein n=1 Tax=Guillardia theta TaxID=55529 RepID=A0A7S4UB80_GUITH|mmetsp:Transcript_48810/g.153226  ORF Transcript_48810/g.153226 Transcript_48810/m.153226 type:complete len:278 (+) Transcript_48810:166-999(+)
MAEAIRTRPSIAPSDGRRACLLAVLLLGQAASSCCWMTLPVLRARDECAIQLGQWSHGALGAQCLKPSPCSHATKERTSSMLAGTTMVDGAVGAMPRRTIILSAVGLSVLLGYSPPASAVSYSTKGLVNTIRLKEGVRYLLLYSLTGKEVDSFQQEVKFLFRDTNPSRNLEAACSALIDDSEEPPRLTPNAVQAQLSAGKIVEFLSKLVEYDGWDKLDKEDINPKFQRMTEQKIKFATRGLNAIIEEIDHFLALFPADQVREAQEVYNEVFAPKYES